MRLEKRGEIGIVRQEIEELIVKRPCDMMNGRVGIGVDQPVAMRTGAEHDAIAGIAATVEVQDQADVLEIDAVPNEGGRAEQTLFFTIGKQEDHVAVEGFAAAQGSC